jgi:hypothetical protein
LEEEGIEGGDQGEPRWMKGKTRTRNLLMEEVKTAINPDPPIENLRGRLSRRTGVLEFLVRHGEVIFDSMFEER